MHSECAVLYVLSSVACLIVLYFPTCSHKGHDFREKVIEHKMCVLIFSTTFVCNISCYHNSSARYCYKYTWVFLMKLEFYQQIFEKSSPTKLNENPSGMSGAVAYGHTDMTKLIVASRNFANSSLRCIICEHNLKKH